MISGFKTINIGALIYRRVEECDIGMAHICSFFDCTVDEIEIMYKMENLDSGVLLRWSKLLDYDFFRPYSQHLILYSPPRLNISPLSTSLPVFRKNIYTRNLIDFILEELESGEKTIKEVVEEYRIPKTTLHKWINKYKK